MSVNTAIKPKVFNMTVREERRAKFDVIRNSLTNLGYYTWFVFVDRYAMYSILIIAINQLAVITGRHPYRVYQVVYLLYRKAMRGAHFTPGMITKLKHSDQIARERCPRCGCDIGAEPGPEDKGGLPSNVRHVAKVTTRQDV